MTPASPVSPPPHVLVVSADESWGRALASTLEPAGYRVTNVGTGSDALTQARSTRPDVVLIRAPLPDLDGLDLCRALRQEGALRRAAPIIGVTSDPITRKQRLTWLQAGAWDFFGVTFEVEELLAKLRSYVGAKREADEAQGATLLDAETGFYNERGLERRARELTAAAVRAHAALGCVVFGAERRRGQGHQGSAVAPADSVQWVRGRFVPIVRAHARLSDTIGWWHTDEVAVLAPGADPVGAALLARRLTATFEATPLEPTDPRAFALKVGYEAVGDLHATPVGADVLLARASSALASARRAGPETRIQRFEP